MRPNWWLGVVPQSHERRVKRLAAYQAQLSVPFGATQGVQAVTPIMADSDFLLVAIAALVTTQANPPTLVWGSALTMTTNKGSGLLVTIEDARRNVLVTQGPVPLDQLAGTGPFPNPTLTPYLFGAGGAIVATVFAVAPSVPVKTVWFTYWGVRYYAMPEAA